MRTEDSQRGFRGGYRGGERGYRGGERGYQGGERGYHRGGRGDHVRSHNQDGGEGHHEQREHRPQTNYEDRAHHQHHRGGYSNTEGSETADRGFGGDRRGGRGRGGNRGVFTNNEKRDEQTFGAISKDFKFQHEVPKPKKQYFKDDTIPQQQQTQWQAKPEQKQPKVTKNRFAGMEAVEEDA